MMKKRIISAVLCLVLIATFTACKKTDTTKETSADDQIFYNYADLSQYVTLADEYKGLTVEIFDTSATDEEIDNAVQSWMNEMTFSEVADKAAEMGDVVIIDYVGKMDGEAFDGGSADDQEFVLGDGGYIAGFQEGIVGMKAGESKDVDVTFPDPYESNPDYAGKPAVFTITVKTVKKTVEPELSDEFLGKYSEDYKTVESLRAAHKDTIEMNKKNAETTKNANNVLRAIAEKSEIKSIPERELASAKKNIQSTVENYYQQYTMFGVFSGTIEEFVKAFFDSGNDKEITDIDAYYAEQAEEQVRMELIVAAVAKAEGLTTSDEEYNKLADAYEDYGYDSKENFVETVGGEGYLRWYLLYNKTLEFLVNNTNFVGADGNPVVYPVPTEEPAPEEETEDEPEDISEEGNQE